MIEKAEHKNDKYDHTACQKWCRRVQGIVSEKNDNRRDTQEGSKSCNKTVGTCLFVEFEIGKIHQSEYDKKTYPKVSSWSNREAGTTVRPWTSIPNHLQLNRRRN